MPFQNQCSAGMISTVGLLVLLTKLIMLQRPTCQDYLGESSSLTKLLIRSNLLRLRFVRIKSHVSLRGAGRRI